jgi:GNAT superfamily N-acetyltransferase
MENLRFIPVKSPEEMKAVEALAGTIWREHYSPIIGLPQVEYMLGKFQTSQAIGDQILQGDRYYLIQTIEDINIGYLSVCVRPEEMFLGKLYLLSSYRNRKLGLGALEFVRALARNRRLKKITLRVHKRNPALKIYQALGFEISQSVVTDIGEGFVMDDFQMELCL